MPTGERFDRAHSVLLQLPMLVPVVALFSLGIALDRGLDPGWWCWSTLAIGGWIGWSLGALYQARRQAVGTGPGTGPVQKRTTARVLNALCLAIACCAAGGWRHHVAWNLYSDQDVARYATADPRPVMIRARMTGESRPMAMPEPTPLSSLGHEPRYRFPATAVALRDGLDWVPLQGNLTVFVRGEWTAGQGGDLIEMAGELLTPEASRNPGQFDFREFARGERSLAWLRIRSPDGLTVIERQGGWWNRIRSRLRLHLDREIWSHVGPDQAPMASAILLGNRTQLSPDDRQLYLLTGTVHLLSISGLHVGIMAAGLFLVLRLGWLPRRTSLGLAMAVVLFYTWTVEFSTPVARAALLICMFCLARMIGRPGRSVTQLAASALILLIVSPANLFSVGAQLSFLAVASLIWEGRRARGKPVRDPLEELIRQTRSRPEQWLAGVWSLAGRTFRVSLVVWLLSLPLVAARFHLVSPVSVLVNPLLLLPMAAALYGGLMVMIFGGWFPWMAAAGGLLCRCSLQVLEWLVEWAAAIPSGYQWVGGPASISVWIFLAGCWLLALMIQGRLPAKWLALWTVLWSVAGWWLPNTIHRIRMTPQQGALELVFVDVGHGNATIIRTPDGRTLMYDAGSFGSCETGIRGVSACLWSLGIRRIDELVISHADVDHFNAVPGIAERFPVGLVRISPQMAGHPAESVRFLLAELERMGVPVEWLSKTGSGVNTGPTLRSRVLAPAPETMHDSDNANSIVLLLEHPESSSSILLTGDIEGPGLESLEWPGDRMTLAVAPHHGSLGSDPAAFCQGARPEVVVISADRDRLSAESLRLYRASTPQVLDTGVHGAIRIRFQKEGLVGKSWIGTCDRSLADW